MECGKSKTNLWHDIIMSITKNREEIELIRESALLVSKTLGMIACIVMYFIQFKNEQIYDLTNKLTTEMTHF